MTDMAWEGIGWKPPPPTEPIGQWVDDVTLEATSGGTRPMDYLAGVPCPLKGHDHDQLHHARVSVTDSAIDGEDARALLGALGLADVPLPEPKVQRDLLGRSLGSKKRKEKDHG